MGIDGHVTTLVNGQPGDALSLPDPGFAQGLAVFEAMRTRGGAVFRLDAHLDRLAASAAFFDIPCPREALHREVRAVATGPGEQAVTVHLTPAQRVVRATPLDEARVGRPVHLATLAFEPPPGLPGWVKHTNRALWLLAARRAGVDEVVFVDASGTWTEASRSNLFVVRGGVVRTPPLDGRILDGVTRREVLAAAGAVGIEVVEAPVPAGPCDEMFVTSTLKGIAGVASLDGRPTPGIGPVARVIRASFARRSGDALLADLNSGSR